MNETNDEILLSRLHTYMEYNRTLVIRFMHLAFRFADLFVKGIQSKTILPRNLSVNKRSRLTNKSSAFDKLEIISGLVGDRVGEESAVRRGHPILKFGVAFLLFNCSRPKKCRTLP